MFAKQPRHSPKPDKTSTNFAGFVDALSWLLFAAACVVLLIGVAASVRYFAKQPDVGLVLAKQTLNPKEAKQLMSALEPQVTGGFFSVDLSKLERAARQIDWLDEVSFKRQWPNAVKVSAVPRYAIARFGSQRLIGSDGVVFTDMGVHQPYSLPKLYGPSDKAGQMLHQFQQTKQWFAPLGIGLSEVVLTDTATWVFKFDSGFRIVTNNQNAQTKLYQLSFLAQNQLRPYFSQIESVDLRYQSGMAVMWKNGEPPSDIKKIARVGL